MQRMKMNCIADMDKDIEQGINDKSDIYNTHNNSVMWIGTEPILEDDLKDEENVVY